MLSKNLRCFILIAIVGALAGRQAHAQVMKSGGVIEPTFKQQLKFGLLARTPSENRFIDEVVKMVDDGDMPRSLVDSTFLWARRKQPYPMPYFERALHERAKKAGIDFSDDLKAASTFE